MPLSKLPRLTPAAAVMPGGVRTRVGGSVVKIWTFKLQGAAGGSETGGIAAGAGGNVVFKLPVMTGDVFALQVGQGGEAGQATAGSGQGGGSARVFAGDSTDVADLVGIAGGGAGAGDTKTGGAGGQTPGSGGGTDAGGGTAGSTLQGGAGTGGDGSDGGTTKGWPDGGDGAGENGVASGGGGGGGGLDGGDGGGPGDNGSGGQGGTSWVDPTLATEITYLDGSGATPNAGRDAAFSGYGAGVSMGDGQDGLILVYDEDDNLYATFSHVAAVQYLVIP